MQALELAYQTAETQFGLSNGREVIDDFRATVEKWEALLAEVDTSDEDALTELAMREIYAPLDPATYGIN